MNKAFLRPDVEDRTEIYSLVPGHVFFGFNDFLEDLGVFSVAMWRSVALLLPGF